MARDKNTLISLLSEYEVCIPIIQRDYAHGRSNEKAEEVRNTLLDDISKCLCSQSESIDFNFVYGTTEGTEKVFYPVDGQQRLTTLYLLHWYLACLDDENFEKFRNLKSFSYRTRNSAVEFFSVLKGFAGSDLREIVKKSKEAGSDLKSDIMNQPWFLGEWGQDPTIISALNFLCDLSKKATFSDYAGTFYQRLEDGAIYFSLLVQEERQEIAESAERIAARNYIRMNARGKVLEDFENVKAMLDSIEKNCGQTEETQRVGYQYDVAYANELYKYYKVKNKNAQKENVLSEVTKTINCNSLFCMKHLYNFLTEWEKGIRTSEYQTKKFCKKLYAISHNNKFSDNDKKFFTKYFDVVNAVFRYVCKNWEDAEINVFLDNEELMSYYDEMSEGKAKIIYLYYCYKENKEVAVDTVNQFIHVLKNLRYEKWAWDSKISKIALLSEQIAKKESAIDYFATTSYEEVLKLLGDGFSDISDYKLRVKEQCIKAKIIKQEPKWWDKFCELENSKWNNKNRANYRKITNRKLQHLLYICGYWKDFKQGNIEDLNTYAEVAKVSYFSEKLPNEKEKWLRYYAVATFRTELEAKSEDKNSPADKINSACNTKTEYKDELLNLHVWRDGFFEWDDAEEPEFADSETETWGRIKERLESIYWIYKKLAAKESIVELVSANEYKNCWLYYAVQGNSTSTLELELKWVESETEKAVYAVDAGVDRSFELCWLCKEKEAEYELKELTVFAEKVHNFGWYGIPRAVFYYPVEIKIVGIENKNAERCIHCEEDGCNQDGENARNRYTVYELKNSYQIEETVYDITDELKAQKQIQLKALAFMEEEVRKGDNYVDQMLNFSYWETISGRRNNRMYRNTQIVKYDDSKTKCCNKYLWEYIV